MLSNTTATQLAGALEEGWACDTSPDEMTAAAAELRRLDAEVAALRKALSQLVIATKHLNPCPGTLDVAERLLKGAAHG